MDNKLTSCPHCGKPSMEGFNYCPFCGAAISDDAQRKKAESAQPQQNGISESAIPKTLPSQKSDVRENRSPEEKTNPLKNKRVLEIVKYSLVVALCAVMLILSFCPIYSFDFDEYFGEYFGSGSDFEIDLLPTDYITGMFACAKNYDPEKDARKIQRLEDKVSDAEEEVTDGLLSDVNSITGKINLSKETKRAITKYKIASLRYQYCTEGNASQKIAVILMGTFSLINILFSFAMLALSVATLVYKLKNQPFKGEKFVSFIPLYLFLTLAILSASASLYSSFIADATIAALFFASFAIVLLLTAKIVKCRKPRYVFAAVCTTLLTVSIAGCCFAPSITASCTTTLSDKSTPREYTCDIGNELLGNFIMAKSDVEQLDEYFEELNKSSATYDHYLNNVKSYIDSLPVYSTKTFVSGEVPVIYILSSAIITDATLIKINYSAATYLSIGYVLIPIIILLMGLFLCMQPDGDHYRHTLYVTAFALLLVIVSLICTIVVNTAVNETLAENDLSDAFSTSIAGGQISMLILSIVAFVVAAISPTPATSSYEHEADSD